MHDVVQNLCWDVGGLIFETTFDILKGTFDFLDNFYPNFELKQDIVVSQLKVFVQANAKMLIFVYFFGNIEYAFY